MLARALILLALMPAAALAAPTLSAPESAQIGSEIVVSVAGNPDPKDFVTIVLKGSREGAYDAYQYATAPGVLKLKAPVTAGDYEIRLLGAGSPYPTLARRALRLEGAVVALDAPAQAQAGKSFSVQWKGPNNDGDYLAIGDAKQPYITYVYARTGSPITLRAPDQAGDYEVRYFLGNGDKLVASRKIVIGAVSASVQGPAEVVGRARFPVRWQGPNNPQDYITVVPRGAREGEYGVYAYTATGNPLTVLAPPTAGEYEVRYVTGQSDITLARSALKITAPKVQPGLVSVTAAGALASDGAVEVILDASGSMLQKLGTQRRIDIAKQTLTTLTSKTIPAGTRFALRVFGREASSCQTDLDIPLAPLHPAAASARIAALEAKNNAKTPIGASLAKVAGDLKGVTRVVSAIG
jgi:von Willebrand factor type A domain